MYKMLNAEELANECEEYEDPIQRWLDGDMRPSDSAIMIDMIDSVLPENQILWPPWVMINIDDGHITLTAHVLSIQAQA